MDAVCAGGGASLPAQTRGQARARAIAAGRVTQSLSRRCGAPMVRFTKGGGGRITAKTVMAMAMQGGEREGGLGVMIKQLVKKLKDGDSETKEAAAGMLSSLAVQNHYEHTDALYASGAVLPLVQILSGGTSNAQGHAAAALHAIAHNKPQHQRAIVEAGAISPLVRLIRGGASKVQESAASALASVGSDVAHQQAIIRAGSIGPLVTLLKGGSVAAQSFASQALANAATYDAEEGQNAIVRAGAVPLLLILLSVGKAQTPAAFALAQLASFNRAVQGAIADAGGIAPLLALLNGRNLEAQIQAAVALAEMARDNHDTQDAIANAGGTGPILALLSSRSSVAQSKGMVALAHLARQNKENQDLIATDMGGIKPLIHVLESSGNEPGVQADAAFALMEISSGNRTNQQIVVDSGGIPQLAALMRTSQHANVKAEVAGTLWALSEAADIKVEIAEANTVQPLVNLLGLGDNERGRQHAAHALSSLARDNEPNQVQITQMLIELLSSGPAEAQQRAVDALWALVHENPAAHNAIAKAGNPAALVELLKSGISTSKDYATWSLSLSITTDTQVTVTEAGGVTPLINQLSDARSLVREQAASALAKLGENSSEICSAITSEGGIQPLIHLINKEAPISLLQSATNAIAQLAVEATARDEIVGAGGVPLLEWLLQGESPEVKTFASTAIARLSKDHEATQAAVEAAGAISPLVALLDGNEGAEAQQEAAGALFVLADHKRIRLAITEAEGIGRLVNLLGCENERARVHAEGALVRLSIETSNRMLIIEKLVDMLRNTDTTGQEQAAAALANLARESEENRNAIVRADGIPPILALLDSQSGKAKENAVSAITELCSNSKSQAANQTAIANEDGIAKLVNVLLSFSNMTMKDPALLHLCSLAAAAIKQMAKGNQENQEAVAEAGAIASLVAMLGAPVAQMQANAAGALANLARNHRANQLAIAKTGAISPLCTLLREGSAEAKDRSASAIWSLATDNSHNKDTIAKLGGIDPLLGLLISGTSAKSQECVAGALTALAHKHPENRAVAAKRLAGYLTAPLIKVGDRSARVLMTCSSFASDSTANRTRLQMNSPCTQRPMGLRTPW